ncbi:MAG: hypothetical protein QE495_13750 [Acidovorax sp.]|uniref:hypothetical protein n=1 Tax=Acidovorax sp. TaxID=1872122 RepID=UPI002626DA93|nr:hypothetical protein [Acidovorax sp.]MDH4427512.1 hypothetical protein [Acidovorax sp.]
MTHRPVPSRSRTPAALRTGTAAPGLHRGPLLRTEIALLCVALALLALACLGPVLPASLHQHDFADGRTLWGIPCAMDVLSNLPFAIAGLWGLLALRRVRPGALDVASRGCAQLFFGGLIATAAGSAVYHWAPGDAGLVWDRLGMVLPFAGLLGLAAAGRVSQRAGALAAAAVLLAGPLAVAWWARTGNLMPWAVVQIGGMLVVAMLAVPALFPLRQRALAVHLGAVIGLYALAKLFEAADHSVLDATGWVSGHTLKHLAAAAAAWPVLLAVHALGAAAPHGKRPAYPGLPQTMVWGQNGAHSGVVREPLHGSSAK